ncbi:hypothetical protein EGH21_21155 [Halomicroarcula sp. F13]|uniref:Uncharacterized protein n=1 Tax=Haloarcula rubra TaxID=2487747 RepID=A0AAW4PZB7_9EURY|nr:hypothetical protein [Halomicroarcula rubra]MBX0325537.1 hypothetical protein [Halomicroarcula rubra]
MTGASSPCNGDEWEYQPTMDSDSNETVASGEQVDPDFDVEFDEDIDSDFRTEFNETDPEFRTDPAERGEQS